MAEQPVFTTPSEAFGAQLRATRERKRWSQQRLAERVRELGGRIHATGVLGIEKGTRRCTIDEALLLCLALDVSPAYMLIPRDGWMRVTDAAGLVQVYEHDLVEAPRWRDWLCGQHSLTRDDNAHFYLTERSLDDLRLAQDEAHDVVSRLREAIRYVIRLDYRPPELLVPGGFVIKIDISEDHKARAVDRVEELLRHATAVIRRFVDERRG